MKKSLPLIFLTLCFFSCKKDKPQLSVPVHFTATTYQTLSTSDSTGKPNDLMTPDTISNALMTYLHSTLPERVNLSTTHPELLSSTAIGDITITKKSELDITFVSEGTTFADAIAFYTYPTNNPPASASDIKTITYVFPNAGFNTSLKSGDKVNIGTFDVGTSVGFVLMKGAWNPATKSLNNDAVHFCSNDVLNPELAANLKKHAVLLNYTAESKVLIGFEDLDRTDPNCDNDFNDVVFYVTTTNK